ncbi:MAG: sulfatase-like hydrolase/transferase [Bdellovibrionales bacterium]|nr:sulfatase-like hydrolase/transferase [Bdellovibrionales bacterium]
MGRIFRQTFVALLLCVLGCSSGQNEKPSYLLIAVEKLPFSGSLCSQTITAEQSKDAFDLLCNEAIRFTHMYTPSTQSQAALTSVLTGLYPNEHKVWHNGNVYLKESYVTAPELLYKNGWRTALFSGGGAIWRKSGLAQGFNYFDDTFPMHWNSYYRPAKKSMDAYFDWLDDNPNKPFFAVIYLPDLLFPSISTQDEEGLKRESTYEGQYRSLLDSLGYVSSALKKRDLWHKTNIIVFGLNGKGEDFRRNEMDAYNLHSENTKVAFYFKPSGKKRDLGHSWKVDYNYSLVDLGHSLFAQNNLPPNDSMFVFKNIFSKDYSEADSNRWIMIESAWPQWKNFSTSRFSLRNGNYNYIFDENIYKYNNLIDQLETNPQVLKWDESLDTNIQFWINSLNIKPWEHIDEMKIQKWKLARKLWDPFDLEQNPKDFFSIFESTQDIQVMEWLATLAIKQGKWNLLLQAGEATNNILWIFTAKFNLGTLKNSDWEQIHDECFLQFLRYENPIKNRISSVVCSDTQVELLYKWIHGKTQNKDNFRELFIRNNLERSISDSMYKLNYIADLSWDMSLRYPAGPSMSDLILSLNKYRTYYTVIKRRMELVQYEKVVY